MDEPVEFADIRFLLTRSPDLTIAVSKFGERWVVGCGENRATATMNLMRNAFPDKKMTMGPGVAMQMGKLARDGEIGKEHKIDG